MSNNNFKFSNKNFLIISHEGWGDNLLSKHHISLTLAELGNRVWFVAPLVSAGECCVSPHPNIFLISHRFLIGFSKMGRFLARLVGHIEVNRILTQINDKIDVIWSFDPFQLQFLRLFRADLSIYHPVDNHHTRLESWVEKEADILLTNSDYTLNKFQHQNKFKVGHGVAKYFLDVPSPVSLPGNFKYKAGYVGNLNNRLFDFDIFVSLVRKHPEVGFYMIGPRGYSNIGIDALPTFDWSLLDSLPNVFWLGSKPSSVIPSYLACMDILLVLYKPDRDGFTVNSHKILEYLSSGKLVITPSNPENEEIMDLVLQANSLEDIPSVFESALAGLSDYLTDSLYSRRKEYARSHTYERQIQTIEFMISKALTQS